MDLHLAGLRAVLTGGARALTPPSCVTLTVGGFWDRLRRDEPEAFAKAALQRNSLQRLASPEELARVVAFVSSPAASFVAGANWYVDGGSRAHVQF